MWDLHAITSIHLKSFLPCFPRCFIHSSRSILSRVQVERALDWEPVVGSLLAWPLPTLVAWRWPCEALALGVGGALRKSPRPFKARTVWLLLFHCRPNVHLPSSRGFLQEDLGSHTDPMASKPSISSTRRPACLLVQPAAGLFGFPKPIPVWGTAFCLSFFFFTL